MLASEAYVLEKAGATLGQEVALRKGHHRRELTPASVQTFKSPLHATFDPTVFTSVPNMDLRASAHPIERRDTMDCQSLSWER